MWVTSSGGRWPMGWPYPRANQVNGGGGRYNVEGDVIVVTRMATPEVPVYYGVAVGASRSQPPGQPGPSSLHYTGGHVVAGTVV
ncbi:MAG: hypothetical protein ACLTXL_07825 [Clostridia bacterium]